MGNPDEKAVSTSFIERANLTVRMHSRRFTRLTNGFSKKMENHARTVALHFFVSNFCRPHMTLTKKAGGIHTTPAMAAGITDLVWTSSQSSRRELSMNASPVAIAASAVSAAVTG